MAQTLELAEFHAEAAEAAREGLSAIEPFAKTRPEVFIVLAGALRQAHLEACARAGLEPDGSLLQRLEKAFDGGEDRATEDDPTSAALKARITAIIEAAQAMGSLDEKALAELPAPLAEELRTVWAAQSKAT